MATFLFDGRLASADFAHPDFLSQAKAPRIKHSLRTQTRILRSPTVMEFQGRSQRVVCRCAKCGFVHGALSYRPGDGQPDQGLLRLCVHAEARQVGAPGVFHPTVVSLALV